MEELSPAHLKQTLLNRLGELPPEQLEAISADLLRLFQILPPSSDSLAVAARFRAVIPFGVAVDPELPLQLAELFRQHHAGHTIVSRVGQFTEPQIAVFTDLWRSLPWRILPESSLTAAENVALDEVLSDSGQPSLRFWRWSEPAVVLGRSQSVENEVHPEAGITILRRLSGGGAMFVQPGGTITYSMILPETVLEGLSLQKSYEICDAWVIAALRRLGVDVHHVPVNDLACWRGKIGGAAQSRRRGIVLHHTTLAYRLDNAEMAKVLRIGQPKTSERAVSSAAKVVSPLANQLDWPREAIVEHLLREFQNQYGGTVGTLSPEELAKTDELVRLKYTLAEWTHHIP